MVFLLFAVCTNSTLSGRICNVSRFPFNINVHTRSLNECRVMSVVCVCVCCVRLHVWICRFHVYVHVYLYVECHWDFVVKTHWNMCTIRVIPADGKYHLKFYCPLIFSCAYSLSLSLSSSLQSNFYHIEWWVHFFCGSVLNKTSCFKPNDSIDSIFPFILFSSLHFLFKFILYICLFVFYFVAFFIQCDLHVSKLFVTQVGIMMPAAYVCCCFYFAQEIWFILKGEWVPC